MPYSSENYTSQKMLKVLRKQALRVWLISLLIVLSWSLLIIIAPFAKANSIEVVSAPIYKFFSFLCHQQSDRSFHIHELPFAVCSRCFGVYFGLFLGFVIYPFIQKLEEIEPFPRFWLFLAMIPIGIDWSLGVFNIWENTHLSRFFTGTVLGIACGLFIVPALVEIFRHLLLKRQLKKLAK